MSRLTDSSKRIFKIEALLAKSHSSTDSIQGNFAAEDGGSYLLLPVNVMMERIQCKGGTFEFKKNRKGEQSLVLFECSANSTAKAHQKFYEVC